MKELIDKLKEYFNKQPKTPETNDILKTIEELKPSYSSVSNAIEAKKKLLDIECETSASLIYNAITSKILRGDISFTNKEIHLSIEIECHRHEDYLKNLYFINGTIFNRNLLYNQYDFLVNKLNTLLLKDGLQVLKLCAGSYITPPIQIYI